MKKVICLIRTSTNRQEVEEQKKEVVQLALSDGYIIDEIEVVGGAGASAIKLDEQYMSNLNKVYQLIEDNNIECVYVWGIDRIGRNEEVLMGFKNRLIKNKVQLVIKNPSLRLLNDDGSVNSGVELAFSLFSTMAKQEMETKKARFHRGKKRNSETGKFNGGTVLFGYTIDDNNYYIIHPQQSQIVKLIFELMSTDRYSTRTLTKELRERGIMHNGRLITYKFVVSVIKNKSYTGMSNKYGFNKIYPRIISDELFDKVQQVLSSNNSTKTKSQKSYSLATLLIKCPECGRHYTFNNNKYICSSHNCPSMRRIMGQVQCNNNIMISQVHLDSILWSVAMTCHIDYVNSFGEVQRKETAERIDVLELKKQELERKISELTGKIERIQEIYIETGNKTRFNSQKKRIEEERRELNNQIIKNIEEIKRQQSLLNEDFDPISVWMKDLYKGKKEDNEEMMYKTVHKYITEIRLERFITPENCITEDKKEAGNRKSLKIFITKYNGDVVEYVYIPNWRWSNKKVFQLVDNILFNPIYELLEKDKTGVSTYSMEWVKELGL